MFTRDQIVSFCTVYEHGSYSSAARCIGRDRSTVREHITIIEDNIGVPLFSIEGRQAVATEVADKLYPRAVIIARQIDEFENAALNAFHEQLSELNLYHDVMIPTALMQHVEKSMMSSFPQVQINWLHRSRQEAMTDLVNGTAHLALMPIKMMVQPDSEVNYINLGSLSLSVYTGVNSPLANKKNPGIRDLQLEKQYIIENHLLAELQGARVSPDVSLVSNRDILVELLKIRGWAILPDEYALPYCRAGVLTKVACYEVTNAINYNICIFHSPSLEHNKVVASVIAMIREYARQHLS